MKFNSKKLFLTLLAAGLQTFWFLPIEPCHAQQEKLGTVGYVNAMDASERTFLKVNGAVYNLRGYGPGEMTMGGAFPEGGVEFSIENAGFQSAPPASLAVDVSQAAPAILIGYLATEKKSDGTTETVPKLVKLPSKASKQLDVVGLYATSKTEAAIVSVNGQNVSLPPWKLVPLTKKAPFTFQAGPDQRVMNISSMASGRIVVVVFDKRDKGLAATLYQDSPSID